MKKSNKTKLIAMSFAVGALLTGCEPKKEQPAEVYGPPTIASTEYKPVTEEPQKYMVHRQWLPLNIIQLQKNL